MARSAFTLIELLLVLVILGILAGIVIPKLVSATAGADSNAAQMHLTTVRRALERYKTQHNDNYPPSDQLWAVMTQKTNANGTLNESGLFGPYLVSAPRNPFNGSITIAGDTPAADDGWVYDLTSTPVLSLAGFDEAEGVYTAPQ